MVEPEDESRSSSTTIGDCDGRVAAPTIGAAVAVATPIAPGAIIMPR